MAKRPKERYASAGEFATAVQDAADTSPDWAPESIVLDANRDDPARTSQPTLPA